jgi:hypothetical protein
VSFIGPFLGFRENGSVDATAAGMSVPAFLEAYQLQNSRGDKTAIELFLIEVRKLDATSRAMPREKTIK